MSDVKNLAYQDYLSGMKYKDIAEKYDVSLSAVKSWAVRDWKKASEKKLQPNEKKVATKTATKGKKLQPEKEDKPIEKKLIESVEQNEELTEKQKLFCLYYIKCRNKTKAYQKAFETSWATANSHAYRLWKIEGVKNEINRLMEEYRAEVGLDIKDLFQWYLDIARADINDFVTITPTGLTIKDGAEIDGILVSEVKEGQYGISVKLPDKLKAMEWLGKHIGLASEEQKARIAVMKAKINTDTSQEQEDDGFIEALNGTAKEDWVNENTI